MNTSVDTAFIRRAIELADLNAVRVTLYNNTGDPEIGALPVTASLTPEQRTALIDKAVAWLSENAGPKTIDEPPTPELRRLMELAIGLPMGDLEFESRRDLPAFKPFPLAAEWEGAPVLPEDFRVAIIGSGFSGLAAAVQMERLGIPYVVIERQADPGGTWTINRYPDIRVDTSSNSYEFLFEKNYKWKEHFGRGEQVREYLTHISRKYGVFKNTRFNTDLKRAVFDEARNRWVLDVATADGKEDRLEANFIISCTGVFANPKQPRFENLEAFKGQIVHPARWPEGLDLAGKRVAVIGNGSTGVQLLGAVARDAAHVSVFQRTPQWISPRDKYGAPVEPEMVWLLENFPGFWNWSRFMSFAPLFQTHDMVLPDPEWQASGGQVNLKNDKLREMLTQYIKTQTDGREDLIQRLVPDYAPFSRRPVVDNGWYRALTRDNVELVTDGIARLTETGIETEDGKVREVDVIITATGFDIVKYLWPAQWVGKGGVDLHESWSAADGPRAYLGMMVPEFPNMFMLYGPNSQPVSGGTHVPIWYIVWSAYAARCMMRMLETGKSRVEVSREAFTRYNEAMDKESLKLILMRREGAMEKNYYVNQEHNRLQVNAPWYGPEFHRMCTEIAWDDLLIS